MQPLKVKRGRNGGIEEHYRCPHCGHPKLRINRQHGVWHCFWEGTGGRLESPVGLSLLQAIASPALDPIIESEVPENQSQPITLNRLHKLSGLVPQLARDYLLSRGLTDYQIFRYAAIPDDDRYSGRVALQSPVTEFWTARAYLPGIKPPYLNPSGKKHPWLTDRANRYVVVEGVFDAMAIERGGWVAAALLGSTLTGDTGPDLFRDTEVLLLLDRRTSSKLWKTWKSLDKICMAKLVFFDDMFSEFKDAGEVPPKLLSRLEALWPIET